MSLTIKFTCLTRRTATTKVVAKVFRVSCCIVAVLTFCLRDNKLRFRFEKSSSGPSFFNCPRKRSITTSFETFFASQNCRFFFGQKVISSFRCFRIRLFFFLAAFISSSQRNFVKISEFDLRCDLTSDWLSRRSEFRTFFRRNYSEKFAQNKIFFGLVVGFYFTKTSWIGSLWFLRVSHWTRFVAQCPRWVKIFGTAEWTTKFLVGLTNRWQKPGRLYQVLCCCINWSHLWCNHCTNKISTDLNKVGLTTGSR